MTVKKIVRKVRAGGRIVRNEGVLALGVRSLQKLQKQSPRAQANKNLKHPIHTKVKYQDALRADFTKKLPDWPGTTAKKLTFNWIMPPPGKGSGGHHNIFRFIKTLEDAGHTCRIYLYADGGKGPTGDIIAVMDSYPVVKATPGMQWLHNPDDMEPADGIFCTSWETAYASFNAAMPAKRFYFVQDFEPYFYPVGGMYTLAENTYKFGFFGVTAGGWLAKKLARDYGMQTGHFDFGSDAKLYSYVNEGERKEVFCYVRPYTERRGFEIAIMALDLFHRKHPEFVINLAGWDVSEYDIPFPYNNLKTLELHELNALYNKCAAGLVLSFTNMSLLPLELLGSGAIPVVNEGENNSLVSNNPYIAYAASNPKALADELSAIVSRKDLPSYLRKASQSVARTTWGESGKKFIDIIERETKRSA
ncbi:MAG TPA: hypothetical protein VGO07_05520 [Candidatus Saccharimonadales bacterium]|jgi:glycosyltransferase involved in cell wall biosynthesis|nr:hypothetical protein [Candidatus Saccharimonadales bacterium]